MKKYTKRARIRRDYENGNLDLDSRTLERILLISDDEYQKIALREFEFALRKIQRAIVNAGRTQ